MREGVLVVVGVLASGCLGERDPEGFSPFHPCRVDKPARVELGPPRSPGFGEGSCERRLVADYGSGNGGCEVELAEDQDVCADPEKDCALYFVRVPLGLETCLVGVSGVPSRSEPRSPIEYRRVAKNCPVDSEHPAEVEGPERIGVSCVR